MKTGSENADTQPLRGFPNPSRAFFYWNPEPFFAQFESGKLSCQNFFPSDIECVYMR